MLTQVDHQAKQRISFPDASGDISIEWLIPDDYMNNELTRKLRTEQSHRTTSP